MGGGGVMKACLKNENSRDSDHSQYHKIDGRKDRQTSKQKDEPEGCPWLRSVYTVMAG